MTEKDYTELVLSIPRSEGKKIMRWKWRDGKEWKMFERMIDDGHLYTVAIKTVEDVISSERKLYDGELLKAVFSGLGILSLNEITEKYLIEFLEHIESSEGISVADKSGLAKKFLAFRKEAKK